MELNLLHLFMVKSDIEDVVTLHFKRHGSLWVYVADLKNMKQYEVPTHNNTREDTDFNEAILSRHYNGKWACNYRNGEGNPIWFDPQPNEEIEKHYKMLKREGKI